jgi:hypothetical protein
LQRRFLVGKFRKNLVEVRDLENFFDVTRKADHFHFAAGFKNGDIEARKFADAGAVEILQGAQIEDEMLAAFAEKARDVFAEDADFEKCEAAAKIDERGWSRMPDCGGKVQVFFSRTVEMGILTCGSRAEQGEEK